MFCSSFKCTDVLQLTLFYLLPYQIKFHEFISRRKSFLSNTKIGSRGTEVEFPHWNQRPTCCVHHEPARSIKLECQGTAAERYWGSKQTSRFRRPCSVFSFPVGGELPNCTNYQRFWLETIGFLPDAENVQKQTASGWP